MEENKVHQFKLREDNDTNAAMEVMIYNDQFQDESYLGPFWYDPDKQEVYGNVMTLASDLGYYYSSQFNDYVKTGRALHKNIWQKQYHRGKDNRFTGNYTKKPRGRVFEFKDGGFKVYVGQWINYYPEAKDEIIYEFNLPEDTQFVIDRHWDLGHGWSDDFLEDWQYNNNLTEEYLTPIPKNATIVETSEFLRDAKHLKINDKDIDNLKISLTERPPESSLGSGVYKFRWSPSRWKSGSRGATRVIYVYINKSNYVYLMKIYKKNEQANLTDKEEKLIKELARQLRGA